MISLFSFSHDFKLLNCQLDILGFRNSLNYKFLKMFKYKRLTLITITILTILIAYYLTINEINKKIFRPQNAKITEYDKKLTKKYIKLQSDEKIEILYSDHNKKDLFLLFHGRSGRREPYIINHFLTKGSVVTPAYPGYYSSSGTPKVKNIYNMAKNVMPFIKKNFPSDIKIHVVGFSLGSQPAFYFGTLYDKEIENLIIIGGFDSIYNMCKNSDSYILKCLLTKNHFDNLKLTNKFLYTKYYQYHHPYDKTVPYIRAKNLFNNVKSKKKYFIDLKKGDHSNIPIETILKNF